jgi:hypothetical protein
LACHISEILKEKEKGYNNYATGKVVPNTIRTDQRCRTVSPLATKERGFERCYGFMGGDNSPILSVNCATTSLIPVQAG